MINFVQICQWAGKEGFEGFKGGGEVAGVDERIFSEETGNSDSPQYASFDKSTGHCSVP